MIQFHEYVSKGLVQPPTRNTLNLPPNPIAVAKKGLGWDSPT